MEHKIAAEFATMTELHEFLARAKTSHSGTWVRLFFNCLIVVFQDIQIDVDWVMNNGCRSG